MAAITADPTTVPVVAEPTVDDRERPIEKMTIAPSGFEGEGFPVRRAFAGVSHADLDPFVHMDQMGEIDYAPGEPRGTHWHPHRGFETVTYIMDGEFLHQDSHGGGGSISDGGTQWMTAGAGVLHIETPPESLVVSGGLFHGLQLWVNLPSAHKMVAPRYQSLEGDRVTLLANPSGGSLIRLIAGSLGGHDGPGSTYSPIIVAHITIAPGDRVRLPWPADHNALVYGLSGAGTVGSEGAEFGTGRLAVFGAGDALTVTGPESGDTPLDVYLLGGAPIGEPVAQYGPFVMNTRAELQQAMADFNAGRLGTIPADGLMPYRP